MGAVRRLVEELRRRGVTVHEWSGWDGRGNEGVGQIEPVGAVLHHTATGYGAAFSGLVASTRSDLRGGVLCNFAGNSDGSLTVVASGLAWHAGRGAGPSLGPLARVAKDMNRRTVGLEIVYPGTSPMTAEQYRTAQVFARAVADLFAGGDIACVRAHAETNGAGGDGKWDPGYAEGKTIDMNRFRELAANARSLTPEEDEMASIAEIEAAVQRAVGAIYADARFGRNKPFATAVALPVWDYPITQQSGQVEPAWVLLGRLLAGVQAIAEKQGVDEDTLQTLFTEAVRDSREEIAREVAAQTIDALRPMLAEALGEDNHDQADAIVTELSSRLGRAA